MEKLVGLKIIDISGLEEDSYEAVIKFENGATLTQLHHQDCCESVQIEQVDGNYKRHIGAIFFGLEEKVADLNDPDFPYDKDRSYDSATATFYTLTTSKGYLDWRWVGESNGYYSESVSMDICENKASDN